MLNILSKTLMYGKMISVKIDLTLMRGEKYEKVY